MQGLDQQPQLAQGQDLQPQMVQGQGQPQMIQEPETCWRNIDSTGIGIRGVPDINTQPIGKV